MQEQKPVGKTQEELVKEHTSPATSPKSKVAYIPGTVKAGNEVKIGDCLYIVGGNGNLIRLTEKDYKYFHGHKNRPSATTRVNEPGSYRSRHRDEVKAKVESKNEKTQDRLDQEFARDLKLSVKSQARKIKKEAHRVEPLPIRPGRNKPSEILTSAKELEAIKKAELVKAENSLQVKETLAKEKKNRRRKMTLTSRRANTAHRKGK